MSIVNHFAKKRPGFTLIELLVVIAIIAILIALLVPAVQKVREAAARTQCINNLKQLALGMHSFHDTNKSFPKGIVWNGGGYYASPRSGWHHVILPYIEQDALYRRYPVLAHRQQWYPYATPEANDPNGPCGTVIQVWLCPSDDGDQRKTLPHGTFAFGNYHAVFGGMNLGDAAAGSASQRGIMGINFGARLNSIGDGSSNTLLLTEYLRSRGASNDQRGILWGDQPGYGHVYTQLSPNSTSPDLLYQGWCNNLPNANLPCIDGDTGPNNTVAARSRHTGGVVAALGDASVQFVSSNVDLVTVWRPMSTISGGEVIGPLD